MSATGTIPCFWFFPPFLSLLCLPPPLFLFFLSISSLVVASTARCFATEAEFAMRPKEHADLCPPRKASPPLSVLCPQSESCFGQITTPLRNLRRHHRHPRKSIQGHRRCHPCCCRLSPACVSCGTPWRSLRGCAAEYHSGPGANRAASSSPKSECRESRGCHSERIPRWQRMGCRKTVEAVSQRQTADTALQRTMGPLVLKRLRQEGRTCSNFRCLGRSQMTVVRAPPDGITPCSPTRRWTHWTHGYGADAACGIFRWTQR